MAGRSLKNTSFKRQKLEKTARRRREQDNRRKARDFGGGSPRNELLPDLKIETVPVKSLQPSPHRTRKITSDHTTEMAASITQYGFCVPMLVHGSEIIDGHTRHKAAELLGIEQVPVIECSHLPATEVRKLRLALNKLGESGEWDMSLLKIEISDLLELDVELASTGFSDQEIDIITLDDLDDEDSTDEEEALAEEALHAADQEAAPDPVTTPGDVWEADFHRIACGNALDAQLYETLMGNSTLRAVITDPPYNVPIAGNVSGLGKVKHDEFAMASGEMSDEQFYKFLILFMVAFQPWLSPGSAVFVFMDWRSIEILLAAARTVGFELFNFIVWHKESGGMGSNYRSAHELLPAFTAGGPLRTNNIQLGRHGRNRTNVWSAPGANRPGSSANEMLQHHATPKPVELIVDAILDVTLAGEIVLDPFLGSGTTLIAAEKTRRRCFGIELEPRFVDVALERWIRLTGRQPILAETGETFAEVAERRRAARERPSDRPDPAGLRKLEWRK